MALGNPRASERAPPVAKAALRQTPAQVAEPNRTHDSVKKRPTDTSPEASAANTTDINSELPLPSTSKKPKILDDKMSQY
ncbi:hypothetical protein EVAR_89371_1 [Eumeta japonica]|uniref:Uncharacterized protein n=1 Tax=Eumeta variegata TaxID=151549 RepID=A0A4C1ZS60_EUMVA|nr:hypothetical protein EVAR_89371_1 [Eumeta japonica]